MLIFLRLSSASIFPASCIFQKYHFLNKIANVVLRQHTVFPYEKKIYLESFANDTISYCYLVPGLSAAFVFCLVRHLTAQSQLLHGYSSSPWSQQSYGHSWSCVMSSSLMNEYLIWSPNIPSPFPSYPVSTFLALFFSVLFQSLSTFVKGFVCTTLN